MYFAAHRGGLYFGMLPFDRVLCCALTLVRSILSWVTGGWCLLSAFKLEERGVYLEKLESAEAWRLLWRRFGKVSGFCWMYSESLVRGCILGSLPRWLLDCGPWSVLATRLDSEYLQLFWKMVVIVMICAMSVGWYLSFYSILSMLISLVICLVFYLI